MKKQVMIVAVFALALAGNWARAQESDEGGSDQGYTETTTTTTTFKEHQAPGKFGLNGAESADGANSAGTISHFVNPNDPNLKQYQQGAPDDYLVWCETCGKFVPASAMRLSNRTAALPRIVSAEQSGFGGGALNKSQEGDR